MYYVEPREEEPASLAVEYLEDDVEARIIAAAFLAWQRTWEYSDRGVSADFVAAKEMVSLQGLDEKHIDTLYRMKNRWVKAEYEKLKNSH